MRIPDETRSLAGSGGEFRHVMARVWSPLGASAEIHLNRAAQLSDDVEAPSRADESESKPGAKDRAVDSQIVQRSVVIELPSEVPITQDGFEFLEAIADTAEGLPR
jgi:hypothetical protein